MTVNAGVRALEVAGVRYIVKSDGVNFNTNPERAESIMGAQSRAGRRTMAQACFIECTVILDDGQDSAELAAIRDTDVTLILQDRTVILKSADYVSEGQVDGTDNSLACRFEAAAGQQVQ